MADSSLTLTQSHLTEASGTMIRLVPSGPDRWQRLIDLVRGAQRELSLVYYTFAPDTAGRELLDALTDAAGRGVTVTLMLDSFGCYETPDSFFSPLRDAGGTVLWFGTRWTPRYLIRNHQKLLIVDRHTVMSGGFNIADEYFSPISDPLGWQDIGVVLQGPAVDGACQWFDRLVEWMSVPRPRFRDLRRLIRAHSSGSGPVTWLVGGPTPRLSPWGRGLRKDLNNARSVTMSMAYFSPDASLMRRFTQILKRGGAVDLVLPAHTDNGATIGASRLLYSQLLKNGATLAEFMPCRLHNKLIVIDDVVLIGSSNFDVRSLYVNMELMLRIDDQRFADYCRGLIDAQRTLSTVVTMASHKKSSNIFKRTVWALSWLVVNAIDFTITRRLNRQNEGQG